MLRSIGAVMRVARNQWGILAASTRIFVDLRRLGEQASEALAIVSALAIGPSRCGLPGGFGF